MVDVPKSLPVEKEPLSFSSKMKLIINVFLGLEIIFVTFVFFVFPIFISYDIYSWFNSSNSWYFIFGTFIPAVIMLIVNGKFEPIYVQDHYSHKRIEKCYCCSNKFPLSEMKTLRICKQCQREQNVE